MKMTAFYYNAQLLIMPPDLCVPGFITDTATVVL